MTNTLNVYWRHQKGQHFEDSALQFLQARNMQLVERNYRCRLGEIDLVVHDGATLVFVEVRYRRSNSHGPAFATVDARKQHKIRNAARHFLHRYKQYGNCVCRFDVMGIEADSAGKPRIQWIPNAFY
ncbi:MAG: YraN family protein [Pseudomonadota bacterium]